MVLAISQQRVDGEVLANDTAYAHPRTPWDLDLVSPAVSVDLCRSNSKCDWRCIVFWQVADTRVEEVYARVVHHSEQGTLLSQCDWGEFFRRHPFVAKLYVNGVEVRRCGDPARSARGRWRSISRFEHQAPVYFQSG